MFPWAVIFADMGELTGGNVAAPMFATDTLLMKVKPSRRAERRRGTSQGFGMGIPVTHRRSWDINLYRVALRARCPRP